MFVVEAMWLGKSKREEKEKENKKKEKCAAVFFEAHNNSRYKPSSPTSK